MMTSNKVQPAHDRTMTQQKGQDPGPKFHSQRATCRDRTPDVVVYARVFSCGCVFGGV